MTKETALAPFNLAHPVILYILQKIVCCFKMTALYQLRGYGSYCSWHYFIIIIISIIVL